MLESSLSAVTPGLATLLSYTMLAVVSIFLIFGPLVTYYYWKKSKRMKVASATGPA
ncbi:MAG: hypothetical protein OK404_00840 [Thaumarchaeota archaeon]|nr:hypothetical protein [Nitrososphaerota archaeon]